MAVPLMLLLGVVVAAGTLYESRYNAEVANVVVYKSLWFQLLLGLLWVNIFCAAVSRWPFKVHHTGFVITHIGLLTLLIGAQITAMHGIDGQLRVVEGSAGSTVFLQQNVLKFAIPGGETATVLTFPLSRSFDRKSGEDLKLKDLSKKTGIAIEQYLPFAQRKGGVATGSRDPQAINLSFRLQSQFFDVQQMLNTENNSQLQMGPAVLRLVKGVRKPQGKSRKPNSEPAVKSKHQSTKSTGRLVVLGDKGQVIRVIPVSHLKKAPVKINQSLITLTRVYQGAVVDGGKVREQAGGSNPALEFVIKTGTESLREISYEKFPNFSLRKNNTTGLTFKYESGGSPVEESGQPLDHHDHTSHPAHEAAPEVAPENAAPGGNLIEFFADPAKPAEVQVVLSKNGKQILEQTAKIGEAIVTPWMGMKITVLSVAPGGVSEVENQSDIQEVEMIPKSPLPPSAVYLRPIGGDAKEGAWLLEGESTHLQTLAGEVEVYYGMDSIELPFKVKLDKFDKVNYPGTETAMSFQSAVRINDVGPAIEIKMNEPLDQQGFTLYQSSYEQGPEIPTASIFSVNHDPGRTPKYFGAIILSLGIAIFTVMRSRWYQQRWARAKA